MANPPSIGLWNGANDEAPIVVLAACAVGLFLLAACENIVDVSVADVNVEVHIPSPTTAPKDCGLGGPYNFKADESKVASFKTYKANGWKFLQGRTAITMAFAKIDHG